MKYIFIFEKKFKVINDGRGVENLSKKKVKSCKIAFGSPVIPEENNIQPGLLLSFNCSNK